MISGLVLHFSASKSLNLVIQSIHIEFMLFPLHFRLLIIYIIVFIL